MKVLFLDHDGVICLYDNWGRRIEGSGNWDTHFDKFDYKAICVLNEIISKTDCEIVVSSDWRFDCSLENMQNLYIERGVLKKPIAYTSLYGLDVPKNFPWEPLLESAQTRTLEILQFLDVTKGITSWVAVDDLDMRKNIISKTKKESTQRNWGLENFVWTPRSREGIKQVGVKEKIINYLNNVVS